MSDSEPQYRTPYADDAVHINDSTDPDEVHDFVRRRALNPFEVNDAVVWNFSTHEPNHNALEIAVQQFEGDRFLIPYQLNQTWAYLQMVLPQRIREATVLRYDASRGYYDIYRNFYQDVDVGEAAAVKSELARDLGEAFDWW